MLPNQATPAVPLSICLCLRIPCHRLSTACTVPLLSSFFSIYSGQLTTWRLNASALQKILKCLFPVKTSLFSFMLSLPHIWKLPSSVKKSLNFILKDKWDFIRQRKVGKELMTGGEEIVADCHLHYGLQKCSSHTPRSSMAVGCTALRMRSELHARPEGSVPYLPL